MDNFGPAAQRLSRSVSLGESMSSAAHTDAMLRALTVNAIDGIITLDEYGDILSFNPAAERIFGYSQSDAVGLNFDQLLPEPFRPEHRQHLQHLAATTAPPHALVRETVGQRKDRSTFPMELVLSQVEQEQSRYFIAVVRDTTEQKTSQNRYLQKTSELQAIFEALPDLFFRITADGVIVDYHKGKLARLRTRFDRVLGYRLSEVFDNTIGAQLQDAVAQVVKTGNATTLEFALDTDNKGGIFQARLLPFLQKQIIVVLRDITDSKKYQELLHQNELRYHTLAEVLPVGIFRTDVDGGYVYVNERWQEIADMTQEQAFGMGWTKAVHQDDRQRIYDSWKQAARDQRPFTAEYRFRHADNVVAWVYCQAVMERDALGNPVGYVGTITDITDRIKADEALRRAHIELEMRVEERTADLRSTNRWLRQMVTEREKAEQALREERNFISTVLETSAALVVVCDSEGRIVGFNRSCTDTTDYDFDEVQNCYLWDFLIPDEDIRITKAAFQSLINGETRNDHESHLRRKDGKKRLISWDNTTIRDADGAVKYIICTGIDITERRQAEEEARQHQADLVHVSRLCTMGEMAAGLAHELNQPLAAIVSYTQGCVRRLGTGPINAEELLEAMRQVTNQAQRAGEIIRRLRNFVSKGEPQRTFVDANAMVREVLSMAKMDIRKHQVKVKLQLAENLPTVHADIIQIEQVILNLVRNGMEAMTGNDDNDRELLVSTYLNSTAEVETAISDRGEGLPMGDSEQVFDAFFTTKKEGMGMGLAISRSIIEAHGGRLWAKANPERGTTFFFTLPIQTGGNEYGNQ